jgi:hypothetical protein
LRDGIRRQRRLGFGRAACTQLQIATSMRPVIAERERTLEHILELTHVAREREVLQHFERCGG